MADVKPVGELKEIRVIANAPDAAGSGAAAAAGRDADVFLSYHSPDREAVLKLRELLATRGISSFLDRDNLVAGMPWPQALETALTEAGAVAVFLGAHGTGLWQKREIGFALDRQVSAERDGRSFPVIPVLLPGADASPGFLFLNTWIDLRNDVGDPDAVDALARAIRGLAAAASPDAILAVCPYRGLKPFDEEDRGLYFGREEETARLLEATLRHPVVALVGRSGSGKTSLVNAGLLPLLRAQRPPAATWDMVSFVPSEQPFHPLAAALMPLLEPRLRETDRMAEAKKLGERLAGGEIALEDVVAQALRNSDGSDRLLLVIEQFEELFNRCSDELRAKVVAAVLRAVERAPLTVVMTLRASFYAHTVGAHPELRAHLERGAVDVGTMPREGMRRAIVEPARRVALEFEAGLVERILDDVGDEPGSLALLEFALTRLWEKRRGRTLTHAAYDEIHSVKGAIAQRAEEFFLALDADEQARTQRVFMSLWAPSGPDGQHGTRRRAMIAELGPDYWPIIKSLADARLIVTDRDPLTGQDTVEIAHDALLRTWKRFESWIAQMRAFLTWRTQILERMAAWETSQRDETRLLHGREIEEARAWRESHAEDLPPSVTEFIRHSSALRERELVARVSRQRRLLVAAGASALLFLVAAGLALHHWREVEEQRKLLDSRNIAAKALRQLAVDPDLAMAIAIRAFDSASTPEAQDVLRKALLESRVRAVLQGHTNVIDALALSADGRLLATSSTDRTVRIWDAVTGKLVRTLGAPDASQRVELAEHERVVFSPDAQRIALVGTDGVARIAVVATGELRSTTAGPAGALLALDWHADDQQPIIVSAASPEHVVLWKADGSGRTQRALTHPRVTVSAITQSGRRVATGSADGSVRLWDVHGDPIGHLPAAGVSGVSALAFGPDGAWLALGMEDGSLRLWQTRSGTSELLPGRHDGGVTRVAFSPDGTRLATAAEDNVVRLWDTHERKLLSVLPGHTDTVDQLAFSPDGRHLATAGADSLAVIWDTVTGLSVSELRGHTDGITGLWFSADSHALEKRVFTSSRDGSARAWAAVTSQDWTVLRGHKGAVNAVEFAANGTRLLSAGADNTARIWDLTTRRIDRELRGHRDSILAAHFSRSGELVVTASRDETARVWNAHSGKTLAVLSGHGDWVREARFNADGTRVITASNDSTARVWDAVTGAVIGAPLRGHTDRLFVAAFSPDGRLVATGSADHTARVWDLVTGGVLVLRGHQGDVRALAFNPTGRLVATASDDGTARVWEALTGREVAAIVGHGGPVKTIEFSSDGKRLLTSSWDGTARVWAAPSFAPVLTLTPETSKLRAAHFSPDGRYVAAIDWDAAAHVWDSVTGALVCGLSGHHDTALAVAFSPDGKLVATASRDSTVRLWAADAAEGQAYPCDACGPIDQVLQLAKQRVRRVLTSAEERQYLGKTPGG